jgi:hypothetical protein
MLFYLGLRAWVNGGTGIEAAHKLIRKPFQPQITQMDADRSKTYHGGTETRRKLKSQSQNLNTEDTE